MTLLEATGLCLDVPDMAHPVLFGKRRRLRILHGVSLSLRRGETLGVIGESGSGKTSLGRTLLRLYEPSAGRIVFDGVDIAHGGQRELLPVRRRLQMIFQDPQSSLNPRKTISGIVAAGLRLHALPSGRADVAAVLDRVGLPLAAALRYPHQLSGGQRQRVGIARAIALRPDLIVADEIVSGLDASTQAQVLALLKDLQRQFGLALIFISHDLSVIRHICDRVAIMQAGRIVEEGETAAIFDRPQSPVTRALISAIPLPSPDPGWLWRD